MSRAQGAQHRPTVRSGGETRRWTAQRGPEIRRRQDDNCVQLWPRRRTALQRQHNETMDESDDEQRIQIRAAILEQRLTGQTHIDIVVAPLRVVEIPFRLQMQRRGWLATVQAQMHVGATHPQADG